MTIDDCRLKIWKVCCAALMLANVAFGQVALTGGASLTGGAALNGVGGGGGGSTLLTGVGLYAKFDESSGNATDSSANNLTLVNNATVTYGAGKVNNCAIFTAASSQYFSHAANAAYSTVSSDFEVAMWVTITDKAAIYPIFQVGWDDGYPAIMIYYNSSGDNWRFEMGNTAGIVASGAAISAGTAYCIFCKYTLSLDQMSIRVDAGSAATASFVGGNTLNTGSLKVGANTANSRYLNGKVDVLMFWPGRVLTGAEETEFYNAGSGVQP